MILAGLGLALTGCATSQMSTAARPGGQQPGSLWPAGASNLTPPADLPTARPHAAATRAYAAAPARSAVTAAVSTNGIISRAAWTRSGLASRSINAMNGVSRITIHHEGWTPVNFTNAADTYDRIETIRQIHTRDRGWADIGYHFVIDRAGRVIQGRDLRYQGAHVSEHNQHNLGILVLGNFEQQKPTAQQVESLGRFVAMQMKAHRIVKSRILTHQEINPTECPGRHLQVQVNRMRHNGTLA